MVVDRPKTACILKASQQGRNHMAFQIIRHAFRMVFGNLTDALKVSVGPYLILMMIFIATIAFLGETGGMMMPSAPMGGGEPMRPAASLAILFLVFVILFIVSWVAVAWHRFILLEEYPGLLPQLAGRPVWPYVGRSIVYALVLILAGLPLFFLVGLLAMPMMMAGEGFAGMLVFVGISGFLTFLWLRIAIALPSVAVGKPITMGDAWRASKPASGTMFGVALLLMAINGLATLVTAQISQILPLVGFVLDVAVQWTVLMLGVSILTTFYGHLIEGRQLTD